MAAEAASEWRDSLGAGAWVVLGVVLVAGIVTTMLLALWIIRSRTVPQEPPGQTQRQTDRAEAKHRTSL